MIYFVDGDECKTVEELIAVGFSKDSIRFVKTYSDKECTHTQCMMARRSFPDLVEIVQTYFPDASPNKVAHVLLNNPDLAAAFCPNIQRFVFMKYKHYGYRDVYDGKVDENHVDSSGISYINIVKLAKEYEM